MSIERKRILKSYLILCEGKDAENFLIKYLNCEELSNDKRFSENIQVFDFGGNDNLCNFLLNLKNMDKFNEVVSLAIIRDAEKDYDKACREIYSSLKKCGFNASEKSGEWVSDENGLKISYILFPLNGNKGTLEDLCLDILSENDSNDILNSIDSFLNDMESLYHRNFIRKHKNKLHCYFSSSDKYVTMPIGLASAAGAFDWKNSKLNPLKEFLAEGFEKE